MYSYETRNKAGLHLRSVNTTFGQRCIKFKGSFLCNNLPNYIKNIGSIKNLNLSYNFICNKTGHWNSCFVLGKTYALFSSRQYSIIVINCIVRSIIIIAYTCFVRQRLITFCVSRRRRKMYCGHARLCLSEAVRPHYCTDPDVTWGHGRGCPLVVHYWVDLQSGHGLHSYGNITRTLVASLRPSRDMTT